MTCYYHYSRTLTASLSTTGDSSSDANIYTYSTHTVTMAMTTTMQAKHIEANADAVVQTYVDRPLLIDAKKFDLRIYALVVSCDPLRIYVYKEGLVRLCVEEYQCPTRGNLDNAYMHLTNYAVNKHSDGYVESNDPADEGSCSKRSLSWLMEWLTVHSGDPMTPVMVWRDISDVIVKTLISIQSSLVESYRTCKLDADDRSPFTCFEVLGFDVILNDQYKPFLLEVNHSPSFKTDTHLDARIKLGLIEDTFRLLNVSADDKHKSAARNAAISQMRLYGNTFAGIWLPSQIPIPTAAAICHYCAMADSRADPTSIPYPPHRKLQGLSQRE